MAKIPFSIEHREKIESGEYKVVTGDGRPVRIISWDKKVSDGRYEIVALVYIPEEDIEKVQLYCTDGTLVATYLNEKLKLVVVTPEPELTPLEDLLSTYLKGDFEYFSTKKWDEKKWNEIMRIQAAELLSLARKQLQPEIDAEIEKAYKTADEVQYRKGREEALKDLPRWKKCDPNTIYNTKCNLIVNGIGRYIILDGYMIDVDRLEKLPGFKEDEK